MRKSTVAMIAVVGLLAVPALAQTSGSTNASSNSSSTNTPQSTQQVQQNIHQDLSKAGYTDIQIMPGSFLVHAKDSKGQPTEMMITPNSLTAVTAMNQPGNSGQSGTSSSTTTHK